MTRSSDVAMIGSFRALDSWMRVLGNQVKGSVLPGYKAERVTFSGGVATSTPVGAIGHMHQAETAMNVAQYIDHSQGNVVTSHASTHYAIKGDGLFAVAKSLAAGEQVYFTRNGEFHKDELGYYRDSQGNYLLSADDIDPMGLVTRDPARFGRPYPDAINEPFAPGAVGVRDKNFKTDSTEGYWQDPLTDGGTVVELNNVTTFDAITVGVGGPSATQWRTNVVYTGFNDTALGGPNKSGQQVRWQTSGFGAQAGARGLYFGNQTTGSDYSIGVEASQTVDFMLDWSSSPAWHDIDLRVVEADGSVVTAGNHYGNGWLNRDQQNGMRTGGSSTAPFDNWDEWYSLNTQRANSTGQPLLYNPVYNDYTTGAPSYFGAVAVGAYRLQAREYSGINTSVNWQIIEDRGTFRESVQTGTTAIGANTTTTIATKANVDRRVAAEVTSPEYSLINISDGWVQWDQKSLVETLSQVDTMTFSYRIDGGAWVDMDVKDLVGNDGAWHTTPQIGMPPFSGNSTIQFKWSFDSVDSKQNNTFGWAIDNFNFHTREYQGASQVNIRVFDRDGAITPGSRIELVRADGGVESSTLFVSNPGPGGVLMVLPVTPPAATEPSKWPFVDATIRIVDPTGQVISEHQYGNVDLNDYGEVYLATRRGFQAALYDDLRAELTTSTLGIGYLDVRDFANVPQFEKWDSAVNGTGRAGRLIGHALEGANAQPQKIAEELVMAQQMYEGLTKLLMAHKQSTLELIDAIR